MCSSNEKALQRCSSHGSVHMLGVPCLRADSRTNLHGATSRHTHPPTLSAFPHLPYMPCRSFYEQVLADRPMKRRATNQSNSRNPRQTRSWCCTPQKARTFVQPRCQPCRHRSTRRISTQDKSDLRKKCGAETLSAVSGFAVG
jgi:hypothetical protein